METDDTSGCCFTDWRSNLNSRDVKVCELICSSSSPIGFNEIRRETGIHQEVLSRILRRLQMGGDIAKVESKYHKGCSSSQ